LSDSKIPAGAGNFAERYIVGAIRDDDGFKTFSACRAFDLAAPGS